MKKSIKEDEIKVAKENMEIDKLALKRKITDYTNTLIIYDYEQALLRQKVVLSRPLLEELGLKP